MEDCFAIRLRQLRIDCRISQGELAKAIGVSQKAIDFWEKHINEPKASYIVKLANYFNVTTDYLLGVEQ